MKQQKEKSRNRSYLKFHIGDIRINLTKEVKNMFVENFGKLMKETEGETKKWRTFHVHGLEEKQIVKMSILPKQSTHSIQSLSK